MLQCIDIAQKGVWMGSKFVLLRRFEERMCKLKINPKGTWRRAQESAVQCRPVYLNHQSDAYPENESLQGKKI